MYILHDLQYIFISYRHHQKNKKQQHTNILKTLVHGNTLSPNGDPIFMFYIYVLKYITIRKSYL